MKENWPITHLPSRFGDSYDIHKDRAQFWDTGKAHLLPDVLSDKHYSEAHDDWQSSPQNTEIVPESNIPLSLAWVKAYKIVSQEGMFYLKSPHENQPDLFKDKWFTKIDSTVTYIDWDVPGTWFLSAEKWNQYGVIVFPGWEWMQTPWKIDVKTKVTIPSGDDAPTSYFKLDSNFVAIPSWEFLFSNENPDIHISTTVVMINWDPHFLCSELAPLSSQEDPWRIFVIDRNGAKKEVDPAFLDNVLFDAITFEWGDTYVVDFDAPDVLIAYDGSKVQKLEANREIFGHSSFVIVGDKLYSSHWGLLWEMPSEVFALPGEPSIEYHQINTEYWDPTKKYYLALIGNRIEIKEIS